MSNQSNAVDMVLRCAARQDVDAPGLSAVEEAVVLRPRDDPEEQAWIASKGAAQERLSEPEVMAMEGVVPPIS